MPPSALPDELPPASGILELGAKLIVMALPTSLHVGTRVESTTGAPVAMSGQDGAVAQRVPAATHHEGVKNSPAEAPGAVTRQVRDHPTLAGPQQPRAESHTRPADKREVCVLARRASHHEQVSDGASDHRPLRADPADDGGRDLVGQDEDHVHDPDQPRAQLLPARVEKLDREGLRAEPRREDPDERHADHHHPRHPGLLAALRRRGAFEGVVHRVVQVPRVLPRCHGRRPRCSAPENSSRFLLERVSERARARESEREREGESTPHGSRRAVHRAGSRILAPWCIEMCGKFCPCMLTDEKCMSRPICPGLASAGS
jgi:hypothetical protein